MSLASRTFTAGLLAGTASTLAAAWFGRRERGHAARPINAIAHIYDGGPPPASDGPGRRNTALGLALHMGASVWWALFFEALFPPRRSESAVRTVTGAAAIAGAAYVVDYHVVGERFRPGFERHLSARGMLAVYAGLAGGFVAARLLGRLRHHQVEDGDERRERRPAEREPDAVVAPETLRQRRA